MSKKEKKIEIPTGVDEDEFYRMHSEYWCKEAEERSKEIWELRNQLHQANLEIIRLKSLVKPKPSGFGQ